MCIGVSKQLYILQMYKPRTDLADTCSPQGNVHTLDLIAVPMPTEWLVDTVQVHWLSISEPAPVSRQYIGPYITTQSYQAMN